ncbi:MAG: beta-ketoacyl-ACP synthase III [Dethiobacteria bacterium]
MSKPLKTAITSIGIALPEQRLTNRDLEKMVETNDNWIISRTGIRERRILEKNRAASDLSVDAGMMALKGSGLNPEDLDLIIVCTSTPDFPVPSTACVVQNKMGAVRAAAFDLNAGCTGFIYGITVGRQFIENGTYKNIMVIGVDIISRIIDWEDRTTCVLFGDGAGAVILRPTDAGRGFISTDLRSDGSGAEMLIVPAGGSRLPASDITVREKKHFVKMNGNEVFKFAVRVVEDITVSLLEKADEKVENLDFLFLHQANLRIIESARKRLGLPMEKVPVNIDRYGNMSAASIPISLYENVESGPLKKGDLVALVAFGAGLTCGGVLLEW